MKNSYIKKLEVDTYKIKNDLHNQLYKIFTNLIVSKFDNKLNIREKLFTKSDIEKLNPNLYDDIVNTYLNNITTNINNNFINKYKEIKKYYNYLNSINEFIKLKNSKINNDSINKFIDNLNSIFNNKIIYDNKIIFINNNQYVINHDINGNKISKLIYINENKGQIVKNNPVFKQDVLAISYDKYTLYYNIYTNLYLGFKDSVNTIVNKKGQFLIINYSLKNMLYLLGNFKKYIKNNKKIKKELESIYINRNNNLKNIVNQFIISLNVSKYTKNRVNNLNINTILLISENKKNF